MTNEGSSKLFSPACNRDFRDCAARQTAVRENRKNTNRRDEEGVIFASNSHERWWSHPHAQKPSGPQKNGTEALKHRTRQEHSRQRNVSKTKNRSDLMSNCAPPICTLNIERQTLASSTLPVLRTVLQLSKRRFPRADTRGLPAAHQACNRQTCREPSARKLCRRMVSEVPLYVPPQARSASHPPR